MARRTLKPFWVALFVVAIFPFGLTFLFGVMAYHDHTDIIRQSQKIIDNPQKWVKERATGLRPLETVAALDRTIDDLRQRQWNTRDEEKSYMFGQAKEALEKARNTLILEICKVY